MDEFVVGFIEEAGELLLQLENDLIILEKQTDNEQIINNIFRVMHTLKGSAGMVGFSNVQDLTHEYENLYELIREGKLCASPEIIDLTLKGKDAILKMLKNNPVDGLDIISQVHLITTETGDKSKISDTMIEINTNNKEAESFLILFSPDTAVFERGLDPDKIINEIQTLGIVSIETHEHKKKWEEQKKEKHCTSVWEIYLRTLHSQSTVEEVFLFYDADEYKIFRLNKESINDKEIIGILRKLHKKNVNPVEFLNEVLRKLNMEKLSEPGITENDATDSDQKVTSGCIESSAGSSVSVSSHKLDELMNLVSELVTITASLEMNASAYRDSNLQNNIEAIEKLTKKFRNNALDLRLVPVGTLLLKFKRQVRDLSKELGKSVNLLIEGQDIEIDKTILKAIESPLQHIIRNSIDHGLEPEDERLSAGKAPDGLLKICAFHSGASVVIQVQDDGRGINLDRVKECAIKKGLISPDQQLSRNELINLILEPGFTTAENVSMVSGRGVGMDVVRKELNSVGGGLEIFTEKGLGTSISMKLPTTLTIIDTLMVDVAGTNLLIPVSDIEYCFRESVKNLYEKDNRYIQYKNAPIPLLSLREKFRYSAQTVEDAMVIVINKFERKFAVIADQILGEHQAVIKPLGELFVNQPYFSGGSIMSDGKLAFILDTNFLLEHSN